VAEGGQGEHASRRCGQTAIVGAHCIGKSKLGGILAANARYRHAERRFARPGEFHLPNNKVKYTLGQRRGPEHEVAIGKGVWREKRSEQRGEKVTYPRPHRIEKCSGGGR